MGDAHKGIVQHQLSKFILASADRHLELLGQATVAGVNPLNLGLTLTELLQVSAEP